LILIDERFFMSTVYTAAVIGVGLGGGLSMAGLAASERFKLVAVADMRAEALESASARYPDLKTFPSYQALFEQSPVDVVCVSTWAASHLEVTRAALELPLTGILVEKPLADNSRDGQTVVELVRAKHLPMVVPHNLLVLPHVREIIERVRGGEIGDLRLIEIECSGWDIINAGIHWLNFALVLTHGDPVETVMAAIDTSTRTYRDGMQVETSAVTYAQTRSGLRIVMNTGDYVTIGETGKSTLFRLIGTRGTIDFYAWESRYRVQNAAFPNGQLIEVPQSTRSGHQMHLENRAAQMDSGTPDYLVAETSLAALELVDAAYLAGKHHCAVNLPLASFIPPAANDWDAGKPYSGTGGGRDGRKLPPIENE
jgi:predicted dehydrogenase